MDIDGYEYTLIESSSGIWEGTCKTLGNLKWTAGSEKEARDKAAVYIRHWLDLHEKILGGYPPVSSDPIHQMVCVIRLPRSSHQRLLNFADARKLQFSDLVVRMLYGAIFTLRAYKGQEEQYARIQEKPTQRKIEMTIEATGTIIPQKIPLELKDMLIHESELEGMSVNELASWLIANQIALIP